MENSKNNEIRCYFPKVNDDLCSRIHLFLLPAEQMCLSLIFILGAVHKSRHRQILQINSFDTCSLPTIPKSYQSSFKNRSERVWNKTYIYIILFCKETKPWAACHFHPHRNKRQILDQKMFIQIFCTF